MVHPPLTSVRIVRSSAIGQDGGKKATYHFHREDGRYDGEQ